MQSYVSIYNGVEVSQRPAYPSSKKAKDWDKLEAEMKKQVCSSLLIYLSLVRIFTKLFYCFFFSFCLISWLICRRRMRSWMETQHWTSFSVRYTRVQMRIWGEQWANHLWVIYILFGLIIFHGNYVESFVLLIWLICGFRVFGQWIGGIEWDGAVDKLERGWD